MHRLEISKTKCYKFNPKTDKFIYILQKNEIDVGTFEPLPRARRLIELIQFRKTCSGRPHLLSTAFMMLVATGFGTLRIGEANVCNVKATKEDKALAEEVLVDVFKKGVKVCIRLLREDSVC